MMTFINKHHRKLSVILGIILLIILFFEFRKAGGISKLRYANELNYVSTKNIGVSEEKPYFKYEEPDYGLKPLMDKYMREMVAFVNDRFDIEINPVEYRVIIMSNETSCTTIIDGEIVVAISRNNLSFNEDEHMAVFIHELFHALSCQDGIGTRITKDTTISGSLDEGFTDYLTDEFIDYMNYDYIVKLTPRSGYTYFTKILECIFEEEDKIKEFAKYYFLDDFSFNEEFEKRVRKASLASILYHPYESMDFHSLVLHSTDFKSKNSFLVTYELLAYYCSTMKFEDKEKINMHFYEIEKWAKKHIDENENIDFGYFHSVLYQSV